MEDNHGTPGTDRMHDYDSGSGWGPGCGQKDLRYTLQLAAALVRGVGLAARDGWRALTGGSPA